MSLVGVHWVQKVQICQDPHARILGVFQFWFLLNECKYVFYAA